MFGKKSSKPQGRIDSLIGAGTSVAGDVTFTGGLRVDGEIKGDVRGAEGQPATLVISEHARIEGNITVSHLVINGTVIGGVHSSDFLELQTRPGDRGCRVQHDRNPSRRRGAWPSGASGYDGKGRRIEAGRQQLTFCPIAIIITGLN